MSELLPIGTRAPRPTGPAQLGPESPPAVPERGVADRTVGTAGADSFDSAAPAATREAVGAARTAVPAAGMEADTWARGSDLAGLADRGGGSGAGAAGEPGGGVEVDLGGGAARTMLDLSQPLDRQLPAPFRLEEASLSFRMPGNVELSGDWSHEVRTTGPTRVWLTAERNELRATFSPPLLIDVQWPMSNVEVSGATWDFRSGRVSDVEVANTQAVAFGSEGLVRDRVEELMSSILSGSRLGRPGYDPFADADLSGSIAQVQESFQRAAHGPDAGATAALDAGDLDEVGLHASVRVTEELRLGRDGGGVRIPAGSTLDFGISTTADVASLARGEMPALSAVSVSSSGIVLEANGVAVARLQQFRILPGGTVDVQRFEPLGTLADVGAGESLVRLIGVLAAVRSGDAGVLGRSPEDVLGPRITTGVAERRIEREMTDALRELVRGHRFAVPGIDLASLLRLADSGTEDTGEP
ncbi:MAG: hypothetical protein HYV63_23350 [Candidatus Schekmanbacteria bacterium]|nr:hypothetical protein [Candidatus Schekmanbacteria bacterium]